HSTPVERRWSESAPSRSRLVLGALAVPAHDRRFPADASTRVRGSPMRPLRSLLLCLLLVLAGCGGSSVYRAGGKVVYPDGTPLPGGVVLCEPAEEVKTDGKAPPSVRGYIQPDGTFRLGTYKDDDGAP